MQCIQDSIFHFVRCLSAAALDGGIATAFYYCVSSRLPVSTHRSVRLGRRDFLDDQIRDPSPPFLLLLPGPSRLQPRKGGREGGSMAGHMDRERHEETGGRKQERVHVWNRSQFLYINPFCRKECMGRAMHISSKIVSYLFMNWDVYKDLDASGVLKNDSVVLEERQREPGGFFFLPQPWA